MSQTQMIDRDMPERRAGVLGRFLAFLYGVAAYVVFLGTILYAIGFVSNLVVPKTLETGTAGPIAEALIVNLVLMTIFALQHSVMARKPFKQWWTQYVPKAIERSTYVLLASLALVLLFLAMAPHAGAGLADRRSPDRNGADGVVAVRLGDRVHQHVPDQPFRAVRAASGRQRPRRPHHCRRRVSARRSITTSCAIRSISASSSRSGRRPP